MKELNLNSAGSLLMPDYETTLMIIEKADDGNHISLCEFIEDFLEEDSPDGAIARAFDAATTIGHNTILCSDIPDEVWDSYKKNLHIIGGNIPDDCSPNILYQLSVLHLLEREPNPFGPNPYCMSKKGLYHLDAVKKEYLNEEGESARIRLTGWKERCSLSSSGDIVRWGYLEFVLTRKGEKWLIDSIIDSNRIDLSNLGNSIDANAWFDKLLAECTK